MLTQEVEVKLLDFGLPMRLASRSLRGYMGLQRDTVGKQPSPSPCSVELAMRTIVLTPQTASTSRHERPGVVKLLEDFLRPM
jgi:hypothetical protein